MQFNKLRSLYHQSHILFVTAGEKNKFHNRIKESVEIIYVQTIKFIEKVVSEPLEWWWKSSDKSLKLWKTG